MFITNMGADITFCDSNCKNTRCTRNKFNENLKAAQKQKEYLWWNDFKSKCKEYK